MQRRAEFDDIRPYYDEEIPAAMRRIAESDVLPLLASYVYPDKSGEEVKELLCSLKTIRDFQLEVMKHVNEQVIARSISRFSYNGLEKLDTRKRYLFISNHRDIMLDSCLLQYALYQQGHETTEITFGANLMSSPLIIDIGKANKMFRVERGGNMRAFYRSLSHLSHYIHYAITEKKQSVWIAQRNGRTKDGNDVTEQGIISMFCLTNPKNNIEALSELNIVPVAISYEWESCDILNAMEVYESRNKRYVKKPGEDVNSIITGILQPKGAVHIEFCDEIRPDELFTLADKPSKDFHQEVAKLIDSRILPAYKLSPNNYIALDILNGSNEYSGHYSPDQKELFLRHMKEIEQYNKANDDVLRTIFIKIYANPLINKSKFLKNY